MFNIFNQLWLTKILQEKQHGKIIFLRLAWTKQFGEENIMRMNHWNSSLTTLQSTALDDHDSIDRQIPESYLTNDIKVWLVEQFTGSLGQKFEANGTDY